jgi:hypothetical protein
MPSHNVSVQSVLKGKNTEASTLEFLFDGGLKDRNTGIWVSAVPVNTKEAFEAGVELWGYPKYLFWSLPIQFFKIHDRH